MFTAGVFLNIAHMKNPLFHSHVPSITTVWITVNLAGASSLSITVWQNRDDQTGLGIFAEKKRFLAFSCSSPSDSGSEVRKPKAIKL